MKTFEFTDKEIITLEKALMERLSKKRRALKNLEKNGNIKAIECEKDIKEAEDLYDKLLELVPDKYMFGKHQN